MLRIIRPANLFLILLLQCFALYNLGEYNYLLSNPSKTIALLLSTSLIAAGGYIINDYFDVKIDLINKPQKVFIGSIIARRWAIILHLTASLLGLFLAWQVNLKTLGIALFCAVLLYLYSTSFKKQFLIGNLIVALLAALSVFICKAYCNDLDPVKVMAYSIFAGWSTFLREIIKDVEDEKGDALFLSNSLAVNLGLRKTKKIIFITTILLLAGVLFYPIMIKQLLVMPDLYFWTYTLFLYFGVALPLLLFTFKLKKADKKNDFTYLSQLLKKIILLGIFSILLS